MVDVSEKFFAHTDFIKQLTFRYIHDEHHAEDLTQDVWVAFLENPPDNHVSIRSWIISTVKNLSYMMHRSDVRRRQREYMAAYLSENSSKEEEVERKEIRSLVIEALSGIREPIRSIILLRYYKGLSYKEIAHSLNISLNTMKTRLKRGLKQMRRRMMFSCNGNGNKRTNAVASLHCEDPHALNRENTINGSVRMSECDPKKNPGFINISRGVDKKDFSISDNERLINSKKSGPFFIITATIKSE